MVYVGAQYYRAPFPEERYWDEDLRQMVDAGLNAVQLWVVWAWVEAKPGIYDFSDYTFLQLFCQVFILLKTAIFGSAGRVYAGLLKRLFYDIFFGVYSA